jgi:hypothetical protein
LLLTSASSNSRFLKTSEQHFPTARYNGAEGQKARVALVWNICVAKTSEQHFPSARYNEAEEQKRLKLH